SLEENLGVSGGRNAGAEHAGGEILAFLDDDAELVTPDLAARLVATFAADPSLAVVSMRIVDPAEGRTARRHVPRIGGDPLESGPVTYFLGGASAIRADAYRRVGGLPDQFFYALEETDLGWRLLDDGWTLRYEAELVVEHPWTVIERHDFAERLTARNRVLVARRRLPWILAPLYVGTWAAVTVVRTRRIRSWLAGTREGLSMPVDRSPMSWRTVLRMARLGRPPII
ncbi:MAG: glycosyltransferase, partial [Actinomycetota bacterium]